MTVASGLPHTGLVSSGGAADIFVCIIIDPFVIPALILARHVLSRSGVNTRVFGPLRHMPG